jgi:hypothetical protein
MRNPEESLKRIVSLFKRTAVLEVRESSISSNKGYVSAESRRAGKRGPSSHIPIEGRRPESLRSELTAMLSNVTDVAEKMVATREDEYEWEVPASRAHPAWEARRQAVLKERGASPVQLAFMYGFSSDRQVRELQIRHGKDPRTGYPLTDEQKPIIGPPRRARK